MAILFANNAASKLAAPVTGSATTITVIDGSKFPTPTGGDYTLVTLTQAGAETSWEIVKVTARSGNVLSVVRAQEGTTAAAWAVGDKIELRLTAEVVDKAANAGAGNLDGGSSSTLFGAGDIVIDCGVSV